MDFLKFALKEMRIKQWVKNSLVYAALIFSGHLFEFEKFLSATVMFFAFCLAASGIYYFNDIFDIKIDRLNPKKNKRPIAAGQIPLNSAKIISAILIISSIVLLFVSPLKENFMCFILLLSYIIVNIFYTIRLKEIVILDVMCIAYGFVIRAIVGAIAVQSEMTEWFLICIMFISLLLAFGKRRNELIDVETDVLSEGRKVLNNYNLEFINQMMTVATSAVIISYTLFVMDNATKNHVDMIFTLLPVLYGIFYYMYIVRAKNEGGSPTDILFKQKPILFSVLIYIVYVIVVRNF